ncbi:Dynein light chain [Sparganum proliferum]
MNATAVPTTKRPQPSTPVVRISDMAEDWQQIAVDTGVAASEQFSLEKDMAVYVKKAFDERFGRTWQCVVGRKFGSYVTHQDGTFIHFMYGEWAFLLYKSA